MNTGIRIVIAASALLLFLSLRLLSLFKLDRALLLRIAGGSHLAAVPARAQRVERP
jgi:hypothetical protein